jgi:hypothetical protein
MIDFMRISMKSWDFIKKNRFLTPKTDFFIFFKKCSTSSSLGHFSAFIKKIYNLSGGLDCAEIGHLKNHQKSLIRFYAFSLFSSM